VKSVSQVEAVGYGTVESMYLMDRVEFSVMGLRTSSLPCVLESMVIPGELYTGLLASIPLVTLRLTYPIWLARDPSLMTILTWAVS